MYTFPTQPKLHWAALVASATLLAACGGGGGDSGATAPPTSGTGGSPVAVVDPAGYPNGVNVCTDVNARKNWTTAMMVNDYFWYRNLNQPNANAPDVYSHFRSMLYGPAGGANVPGPDRFSYVETQAEYNSFQTGSRAGYGYSLACTAQDVSGRCTEMRARTVEPQGPINATGLQRGEVVVSVNGLNAGQVFTDGLAGPVGAAGIARTFVIRNAQGVVRSATVNSAEYDVSPVLSSSIFTQPSGQKVGYVMFNTFIESGRAQLDAVFAQFAQQNVRDVIVDLRYNGGGLVSVSQYLGSLTGGNRTAGATFTRLTWNDKNTASNQAFNFVAAPNAASGLTRVFVLAGPGTASASEMFINSLQPFMQVVVIGETTFGKNSGFLPIFDGCQTATTTGYVFSATNFEFQNANGVGDFVNGISATCAVPDDPTRNFNDPAERRIAAALAYQATGACPASAQLGKLGGAVENRAKLREREKISVGDRGDRVGVWLD